LAIQQMGQGAGLSAGSESKGRPLDAVADNDGDCHECRFVVREQIDFGPRTLGSSTMLYRFCYSTSKDVFICLGSTINVQVGLNMMGYLWQLDTQEHWRGEQSRQRVRVLDWTDPARELHNWRVAIKWRSHGTQCHPLTPLGHNGIASDAQVLPHRVA
jgi:hypothetical protein